MKIISGILVLITVFFSIKHGWSGLTNNLNPEAAKMMSDLGLSKPVVFIVSLLTLSVGILILFPQTFFVANLINATTLLLILALQVSVHNLKGALIEIPFILMPLALIYLGYPLRNTDFSP